MFKFKGWLVGLLAASVSSVALAGLSSADLSTQGDGLLTLDSESGLAWLDITATRGMSVLDVIGAENALAPDWLSQGFRFAKASELDQLVQHGAGQLDFMAWMGTWAASPDVSAYLGGATTVLSGILAGDGSNADGSVRADTLLLTRDTRINSGEVVSSPAELVGDWTSFRIGYPVGGPVVTRDDLLKALAAQPADAGSAPVGMSSFSTSNFGDFLRRRTESVSPMSADLSRGVFLVKDVSTVPEPSSWALMALGLLSLCFAVRRQR